MLRDYGSSAQLKEVPAKYTDQSDKLHVVNEPSGRSK